MTDCVTDPQQKSGDRGRGVGLQDPAASISDSAAPLTVTYITPLTTSGLAECSEQAYSHSMQKKTCKICLVEHDEEIHAATLSLRQWLREKVNQALYPEQREEATRPAA
jgi:hypothetical protein